VIGRVEVDDRPRQITHGGGHDVTVLNEHPTTTIYYGGPNVSSTTAVGSLAPGASVQLTTPFYVVTAPLKRGQVMVGRVTPAWGQGTLPQTVGAQDPDPVLSVFGAPHSLTQDGGAVVPQRTLLNVISPLIVFDDSIGGTSNLALGSSPHFDGDPTAVTQALADNSTKLATTAYVDRAAIPKQLVDAKGDLLAASADNTVVRVVVGTDGQVLTADAASPAGVKWGATIAGALSALSASVPDKVRWQYPGGTDVVELWGERTAAGYDQINLDDFTTTTSGGVWTSLNGSYAGMYSGGALVVPSNAHITIVHRDWASNDTAQVSVKVNSGVQGGTFEGMILAFEFGNNGAGQMLGLFIPVDGSVQFLSGNRSVGGDKVQVLAPGTIANNVQYELFFARNGNSVDWRVVRVSDGVVIGSGNQGIAGGKQATYGAGITATGVILDPAAGGSQSITIDDLKRYASAPERRDLFLAVTPQGGTRLAKRIFGSTGSGSFRSDFAQLVTVPGTTVQVLQLPVFTVATLPSAASLPGVAVYVSDAPAGTTKIQYSDGTSWLAPAAVASPTFTGSPAAPTQAAADGSTKLATTAYADRVLQQFLGLSTQGGTAYTAVLGDAGKVIESNNAGAMTITIPPNSSVAYPIGTRLGGVRLGAGTLTIVQGASVVLRNRIEAAGTTNRTVPAQYGMWEAYKRGTDEWVLTGDIA
jgi:hypothetical protein